MRLRQGDAVLLREEQLEAMLGILDDASWQIREQVTITPAARKSRSTSEATMIQTLNSAISVLFFSSFFPPFPFFFLFPPDARAAGISAPGQCHVSQRSAAHAHRQPAPLSHGPTVDLEDNGLCAR